MGIVMLVVAIFVITLYVSLERTDMNKFNDANRPSDQHHSVSISTNYPDAGTIASTEGWVLYNDTFECTVTSVSPGYVFEGWFSDHRLVSKEMSFDFVIDHDVVLEARFFKLFDASFTITQTNIVAPTEMTLTPNAVDNIVGREWVIKDAFTGEQYSYTESQDNGSITFSVAKGTPLLISYTIEYSNGDSMTQNTTVVINEDVTKTFNWRYMKDNIYSPVTNLLSINNGSVSWNVLVPLTEYYYATKSTLPRTGATGAYRVLGDYVTSDSRVIVHMAENLSVFTSQMSDIARADFVLKFVQSLPYQTDLDGKGVSEYYKLPIETLWEGKGDCEDHAILFVALMKALGYDAVLYHIYCYDSNGKYTGSHVAAGIAVEGASGYSTTVDGVEYFYCEATAEVGTSWINQANVGYKPDGFTVVETWKI
ncbi:transglutaminase domain-containing protein [Candidatus Methanoplasma termitum]|uniref:transglutaminase domain-containing protein n=1 Tax=Candidatus Methanoplasma termitum TaxID=1577791 RepID=UPI00130E512F|nr:transglutaminase domain-containing protein [Candidatus Methanoplasma termitum]